MIFLSNIAPTWKGFKAKQKLNLKIRGEWLNPCQTTGTYSRFLWLSG